MGYSLTLADGAIDGAALANSTTTTSLLHAQSKVSISASMLRRPGQMVHLRAAGRISTVVTTPGTLLFTFRMGPTAAIIACTSQALALNVVAKTNVDWELDWVMRLSAAGPGTTGQFLHQGRFESEAVIGSPLPSAGGSGVLRIPGSAPANGTGFDTTVDNLTDLFATWSVANAANSIQVHQYHLELLNYEG